MKLTISLSIIVIASFLFAFNNSSVLESEEARTSLLSTLDNDTPVSSLLQELGDKAPLHILKNIDTAMVRHGKEIVFTGTTTGPNGKKIKKQSKYFVCIDCHNTVQEDPDLTNPNPEARLKHAAENKIPFLQGTTFHGIVNREHWYNEDYIKKYGNLVIPTNDTLINALHLCAVECSQGRDLNDWEMEAVLSYLWSIEFTIGDLNLSAQEKNTLSSTASNSEKIALLKSKYFKASPATFLDPIPFKERNFGKGGDPENGQKVFEQGCIHCHNATYGAADLKLESSQLTKDMFKRNLKKSNDFNLYYITRKGTHPYPGHRRYMPHYTLERMSHQQLEDLIAYMKKK